MYTFRRYVEGMAVHDDDTGKSRLLSKEEEEKILEEIPALRDPATVAYHVDFLPPCIYGGVNMQNLIVSDSKRKGK